MKNYKTPIIFCPSIEDGGVEKNLYLISNYLINKLKNLTIVTANKDKKKKFRKNIKFLAPLMNFNNSSRRIKALICLFLIFNLLFNYGLSVSLLFNLISVLFSFLFALFREIVFYRI